MTTTRRWWVFALICLALFMRALDSLVVTTALSAIGRSQAYQSAPDFPVYACHKLQLPALVFR
jgi:hypothetical protein